MKTDSDVYKRQELYFYANEAGRNGVLSYNIMNELNHTGNKNDNSAIDVAVNLDWKVASWMRFSSILGLSRSCLLYTSRCV